MVVVGGSSAGLTQAKVVAAQQAQTQQAMEAASQQQAAAKSQAAAAPQPTYVPTPTTNANTNTNKFTTTGSMNLAPVAVTPVVYNSTPTSSPSSTVQASLFSSSGSYHPSILAAELAPQKSVPSYVPVTRGYSVQEGSSGNVAVSVANANNFDVLTGGALTGGWTNSAIAKSGNTAITGMGTWLNGQYYSKTLSGGWLDYNMKGVTSPQILSQLNADGASSYDSQSMLAGTKQSSPMLTVPFLAPLAHQSITSDNSSSSSSSSNYNSGVLTVIGKNYTTGKPQLEEIIGPSTGYKMGIVDENTNYIPAITPTLRVVTSGQYDTKSGLLVINDPYKGYTDAQLVNMYGYKGMLADRAWEAGNPSGAAQLGANGRVVFTNTDSFIANSITNGLAFANMMPSRVPASTSNAKPSTGISGGLIGGTLGGVVSTVGKYAPSFAIDAAAPLIGTANNNITSGLLSFISSVPGRVWDVNSQGVKEDLGLIASAGRALSGLFPVASTSQPLSTAGYQIPTLAGYKSTDTGFNVYGVPQTAAAKSSLVSRYGGGIAGSIAGVNSALAFDLSSVKYTLKDGTVVNQSDILSGDKAWNSLTEAQQREAVTKDAASSSVRFLPAGGDLNMPMAGNDLLGAITKLPIINPIAKGVGESVSFITTPISKAVGGVGGVWDESNEAIRQATTVRLGNAIDASTSGIRIPAINTGVYDATASYGLKGASLTSDWSNVAAKAAPKAGVMDGYNPSGAISTFVKPSTGDEMGTLVVTEKLVKPTQLTFTPTVGAMGTPFDDIANGAYRTPSYSWMNDRDFQRLVTVENGIVKVGPESTATQRLTRDEFVRNFAGANSASYDTKIPSTVGDFFNSNSQYSRPLSRVIDMSGSQATVDPFQSAFTKAYLKSRGVDDILSVDSISRPTGSWGGSGSRGGARPFVTDWELGVEDMSKAATEKAVEAETESARVSVSDMIAVGFGPRSSVGGRSVSGNLVGGSVSSLSGFATNYNLMARNSVSSLSGFLSNYLSTSTAIARSASASRDATRDSTRSDVTNDDIVSSLIGTGITNADMVITTPAMSTLTDSISTPGTSSATPRADDNNTLPLIPLPGISWPGIGGGNQSTGRETQRMELDWHFGDALQNLLGGSRLMGSGYQADPRSFVAKDQLYTSKSQRPKVIGHVYKGNKPVGPVVEVDGGAVRNDGYDFVGGDNAEADHWVGKKYGKYALIVESGIPDKREILEHENDEANDMRHNHVSYPVAHRRSGNEGELALRMGDINKVAFVRRRAKVDTEVRLDGPVPTRQVHHGIRKIERPMEMPSIGFGSQAQRHIVKRARAEQPMEMPSIAPRIFTKAGKDSYNDVLGGLRVPARSESKPAKRQQMRSTRDDEPENPIVMRWPSAQPMRTRTVTRRSEESYNPIVMPSQRKTTARRNDNDNDNMSFFGGNKQKKSPKKSGSKKQERRWGCI